MGHLLVRMYTLIMQGILEVEFGLMVEPRPARIEKRCKRGVRGWALREVDRQGARPA